MAASDLLSTRLFVPPIRQDRVLRPRLAERLNAGLDRKLTLISAPAGYGKTLLATEWVADLKTQGKGVGPRPSWVTLDAEDSDPARFLAYLISAIRTVEPRLARGTLSALRSSDPELIHQLVTKLINDLAEINERILLVLDDYHVIDSAPVDDLLTYLLESQPRQLHLVILTREDPALPIARFRARGELTEVRAADLRFTLPETGEFLNELMGLGLSQESIAALEDRTEGWIAGLQLAAISMRGADDTDARVKSFAGSHRFVLDYLVEEVLEQQPESVQTFLLETSILRRLSGPLCAVLTGQGDSAQTLKDLDRGNLFLVPLDEERCWYRYHHMFSDLLSQRLQATQPDRIPMLHLRASSWYEESGLFGDAIEHALSAGDTDRAARLAEGAWSEMHMSYRGATWLRWAEAIPDPVIRARPVLSAGFGWSFIDRGDLAGAEARLNDAERGLQAMRLKGDPSSPERASPLANDGFRSLYGSIANARAYLTQASGDVDGTVEYANKALALLPEDDHFERGLSSILPGFAFWANGELEAAHKAICGALEHMRIVGRLPFIISFTAYLADITMAQGRLRDAHGLYRGLLDLAKQRGCPDLPELSVVHFGLSEICLERDDLPGVRNHVEAGEELGELPAFPPWYRHWVLARLRLLQQEGESDQIFRILEGAQGLYNRHPIPDVRPWWAIRARALISAGRVEEALQAAREEGLRLSDPPVFLSEFGHLTMLRALLADPRSRHRQATIMGALGLLERLRVAAEEQARDRSVIEILILQALAHDQIGQRPLALDVVKAAIDMAESEGYVYPFLEHGLPMFNLLSDLQMADSHPSAYIERLVGSMSQQGERLAIEPFLVEPLSERELEVLEQIAAGLTNHGIAENLFLSVNTVKAHTRNIYGKLDVNSRTQAVARARDLGLLES